MKICGGISAAEQNPRSALSQGGFFVNKKSRSPGARPLKNSQTLFKVIEYPHALFLRFHLLEREVTEMLPFQTRRCFKIFRRLRIWGEGGSSMVGALMGVGLLGILAVGISKITSGGMRAQKTVELRSDINYLRQMLAERIDCTETLNRAMQQPPASASINQVCQSGKQFYLYGKSAGGVAARLTTSDYKIGDWVVKTTCTADKSLEITVEQPGRNDPLTGKPLAKPLFGAVPPLFPICFTYQGGGSTLLGHKAGVIYGSSTSGSGSEVFHGPTGSASESYFEFFAPPGARFVELIANGVYGGKGDSGPDNSAITIIVDIENGTYSGTQVISIGSDDYKKRSVYWPNLHLGQNPQPHYRGFTNWRTGGSTLAWQRRRFTDPLVQLRPGSSCSPTVGCFLRYSTRIGTPDSTALEWWNESVQVKYFGD
jgi:hypothetical protein